VQRPNTLRPDKSSKHQKKRRSLRRGVSVCDGNGLAHEPQGLVLDISQDGLDDIITKIGTGASEAPEAALAQIYGLALDALAETLQTSLLSFAQGLGQNTGENPLGTWLSKILPVQEPEKMTAFAASLSEKIVQSKDSLRLALSRSVPKDPQEYRAFADAVRRDGLLPACQSLQSEEMPSAFGVRLPRERLVELLQVAKTPTPSRDEGKRVRERFALPPGALPKGREVRLSWGNSGENRADTHACETTKNEPGAQVLTAADFPEATEHDESAEVSEIELSDDCADTMSALGEVLSRRVFEAITGTSSERGEDAAGLEVEKDGLSTQDEAAQAFGRELLTVATQMTDLMSDIAMQFAQSIVESEASAGELASLRTSLQDDPRVSEDADLSDWLAFLDGETDEPPTRSAGVEDGEISSPTNDDLAAAFDVLLGQADGD